MTGRRLESGGTWIDRSRPIRFTFDGRDVDGFAGDTVASALLASGERGGFVSPLQGRPRGDRDGRGGGTERLRRDLGAVVRADPPRDDGQSS